ncbi:hypothetical protein C7212DRAFT_315953 [Tuber magnatum]|uniref:Ribosomal protein/NADH dehydrogenase domain-containing protein n=1 Tax=Tuber magnatum TaxID=42249 RepID=A0A317SVF7_9PEZI|nr:hypothetical protein C7212DRAFT_315953 [Tuber magnatum]
MAARLAFGNSLKELRFLFCQTGEGSAIVRAFVQKSYPLMKKQNPHTPILIREASGTPPRNSVKRSKRVWPVCYTSVYGYGGKV